VFAPDRDNSRVSSSCAAKRKAAMTLGGARSIVRSVIPLWDGETISVFGRSEPVVPQLRALLVEQREPPQFLRLFLLSFGAAR